MSVNDFASVILAGSLAFSAILFGVFGIFFSVYTMYAALPNPERSPACDTMRRFCRFLSILEIFSAVGTVWPLYSLTPRDNWSIGLALSLCMPVVGLTSLGLLLAWWRMH
jgi:hypothetical protein